jgi:GNAT superfamily N-acetyltransferase
MMIQIFDSNVPLPLLESALAVSIEVFTPSPEELSKYHQGESWQHCLHQGGILVLSTVENEVIGFAICYKNAESMHIWIAGVLEEYRKHGVWQEIHQTIVHYAVAHGKSKVTLNTYQSRFPNMFAFAVKNKYTETRVEYDPIVGCNKSFFEKVLTDTI